LRVKHFRTPFQLFAYLLTYSITDFDTVLSVY